MTQLLDYRTAGLDGPPHDDARLAVPVPAGTRPGAILPGDDADPIAPHVPAAAARPRQHLIGALAATVMIGSLAVVAVAAAALSFPAAARHLHLAGRDTTWLVPVAALAAAVAAVTAWRTARRLLHGTRAADLLTITGASVATAASASGMWRFFAVYIPQLPLDGRIFVFAFLEIFVLASASRARDNMRDFGSAGIDGAAMWAGTCASAFLSCLASTSAAEVLFRFAPPLAAAWLWERQLVSERRRTRRTGQISWRISPQRILVRVGLADPVLRDVGDVAAQRHITQVALAAERAATATAGRRRDRADRQLRTAIRGAVEHAALATDPARQRQLIDQIAVLRSWQELATMRPAAPWDDVAGRRPRGPGKDHKKPPPRPPIVPPDGHDDSGHPGLADSIRQAMRDGDQPGARVHALLSGRGDYDEFARWLGQHGKFGAKRLLALTGLYATRDLTSPSAVAAWIAGQVPGPAGHVEKADIRRMRDLIAPAWDNPVSAGPGTGTEQQ